MCIYMHVKLFTYIFACACADTDHVREQYVFTRQSAQRLMLSLVNSFLTNIAFVPLRLTFGCVSLASDLGVRIRVRFSVEYKCEVVRFRVIYQDQWNHRIQDSVCVPVKWHSQGQHGGQVNIKLRTHSHAHAHTHTHSRRTFCFRQRQGICFARYLTMVITTCAFSMVKVMYGVAREWHHQVSKLCWMCFWCILSVWLCNCVSVWVHVTLGITKATSENNGERRVRSEGEGQWMGEE